MLRLWYSFELARTHKADNKQNNLPFIAGLFLTMQYPSTITQQYSEYLLFRNFYTGHPVEKSQAKEVFSVEEAKTYLEKRLGSLDNAAILLSGGMDSAILLPYMPKSTVAYTIFHEDLDEESEVEIARSYCEKFGIEHKVISINPKDYVDCIDKLMINKKMPLSPAEPILHLVSKVAIEDGFSQIVTGAGADQGCGGFSKSRRDYSISGFQKRLEKTYVNPSVTLKSHANIHEILKHYTRPADFIRKTIRNLPLRLTAKTLVDTRKFFNEIGIERFAYNNAIHLAGGEHIAPLKEIYFNYDEVKNQKKPKYFIQDIYESIYGKLPPKKLGLQKPAFLLRDYKPSNFDLFREDLKTDHLPYNKKFLIYCLERFENLRLNGKV